MSKDLLKKCCIISSVSLFLIAFAEEVSLIGGKVFAQTIYFLIENEIFPLSQTWKMQVFFYLLAKKRSRNHINPKNLPNNICPNIIGIVTKLKLNAPLFATSCIPIGPKNIKAAGIMMLPPKITSANSLVLTADRPERTTSSFFFR